MALSVTLSPHAEAQIANRPVCTCEEVLAAVEKKLKPIRRTKAWEALVIVKWLNEFVRFPDGSNGECVVACVDPDRLEVKTVMLRRRNQVQKNQDYGQFV